MQKYQQRSSVSQNMEMESRNVEGNQLAAVTPSEAFANILSSVGGFGKWQWRLTLLASCGIFTSMHNLGAIFLAAFPDHWCQIQNLNLTAAESWNVLNKTTPWKINKDGDLAPSRCHYYDFNYASVSYSQIQNFGEFRDDPRELGCESWHYDQTIYSSTVVSQWDLVCDRRWLQPTVQASYMFGILVGAVFFSFISDSYGRRKSVLICVVIFCLSTLSAAFSVSFGMFLALRFLIAASGQGMYLANFITVAETTEGKGRTWMQVYYEIPFIIGAIILTTIAYFMRDWRQLQLCISVPTFSLFIYFWLLPESPRWLFMKGRFDESLAILKQIAETNGGKMPEKEKLDSYMAVIENELSKKEKISAATALSCFFNGLITFVRTPNMRRRSLIVFYAWFVASSVSYGLSFSGHNLNLSLYTMLWIKKIIIAILNFFHPLVFNRFGRRLCFIILNLMGGALILLIIFIPKEYSWMNLILVTGGSYFIGTTFNLCFIITSEVVPTDVRNLFMGVGSFWGRVGSIMSPYVVDLLGEVYYAVPFTIFGIMALLSGIFAFFLPETGKRRLPESIEEIESLPK